jgi:hypothetical protein
MRSFLPSRLELNSRERAVQLQFTGTAFEMVLFERGNAVARGTIWTAAELRQVTIDMRQVEKRPVKLVYSDRKVVVELQERIWARVPDVLFMRLIDLSVDGAGTSLNCAGEERPR